MDLLNRAPFVRLLLPLAVGIILCLIFPAALFFKLFLPLICSIPLILFFLYRKHFVRHYLFGFLTCIFLCGAGFMLCMLHQEEDYPINSNGTQMMLVRLLSDCSEKEKHFKAFAKIEMIRTEGGWVREPLKGDLLLYLTKDLAASRLLYGDELLVCTPIHTVPPPKHGMFNYKTYLADRNVYFQTYVRSHCWKFISGQHGNTFILWCKAWRNRMLDLFRAHDITGNEFSVGSALLLGYEDKLDKGLLGDYSASGVMHILSVSGMHVGIIYVVFNACFRFMNRFRHGALIRSVMLLFFLWTYTVITGLSPAVLRSALMLSFLIAGNALRRKTNIFNSLAASAFILLCMDPLLIRDAGFQLSYIAVGGIVAVFPLLYKPKEERSWIWEQILSLLCVSLAAQMVTFPLSLYYFHQFPNYFLLANLLIVPLSTLVIYSGIGLLLFASVPLAGGGLGWCFRHLLSLLNQTVELTAHLPGSTLKNITLTITGTIILYCVIITLLLSFSRPRSGNLKLFLTATIAFVTCLITGL